MAKLSKAGTDPNGLFMRTKYLIILVGGSLIAVSLFGRPGYGESDGSGIPPDSVAITTKSNAYVIAELNKHALDRLKAENKIRADEKYSSHVLISPEDKNVMCEIFYSQGIGMPGWYVHFGYDGKIHDIRGRYTTDGHSRMITNAPSGRK